MLDGGALWAIVGVGVIVLGIVMAYGAMRRRRGSPEVERAREEVTREIYREEQR